MRKPPLGRLPGFLLASAVLIGAVVILSGLVVGWFFEHHVLTHEEEHAVSVVQSQASRHLAPTDFDLPRWSGTRKVFEAFKQELPGVFRIKVYGATGRLVWSNEPQLIGRAFPEHPSLARALKGQVVTVLRPPRRGEHIDQDTIRHLAEVYVPVTFPQVSGVAGVIETYRDVSEVVLGIRRTQRLIWGAAGGMGLFLYVALAFIVWRASVNEQRAITEIREAHERLAAIMAGITDRMVIVDRRMRVLWTNAVAADAYNLDDRSVGLPCFQTLGAEPEVCESCPAVRTFQSGNVERGVRIQRLPGGAVRHLDLVTAPLRDASGRVQQVLEVARDITQRVELEDRLKQSAARLQESHAALVTKTEDLQRANETLRETQAQLVEKERLAAAGQIVVGLHHEILNPLTGVLGALQLLKQDGMAQPEKAEAFAEAEAEIRKIEQLIRRLPTLRRAAGVPYVGDTTMLDLERSCAEEERT
jgi:PAS domain-containing protein